MRKALLCPSVLPRQPQLLTMLRTLEATPSMDDWSVYLVVNGYDQADLRKLILSRRGRRVVDRLDDVIALPAERGSVFLARHRGLNTWRERADVWGLIDDDFEFLPGLTDYQGAIEQALLPGVGAVSCNWARSEAMLQYKQIEPRFIRQPLINTSGGIILSAHAAGVLADSPPTPWLFDDIAVGLTLYLAGYDNYRYLGSLVIHRILQSHGVKEVLRRIPLAKPDPAILPLRPSKIVYTTDANYLMPVPRDLTPLAHQRHRAARAGLGL